MTSAETALLCSLNPRRVMLTKKEKHAVSSLSEKTSAGK